MNNNQLQTSEQNNGLKPSSKGADSKPLEERSIQLPITLSIRQLAEKLGISAIDVIKQLMRKGIMVNINQVIDYEAASTVAIDFGYQVSKELQPKQKSTSIISEIKRKQRKDEKTRGLSVRPPVVTIMGHVDHGKTRLLDAIRQTDVMASEVGGITQHIGAYQISVEGKKITFLDTPGHEAFTAMRARGAQVTDITILVVAADDGVMPQTLEAIDHARAAGVSIVIAINKIDKPEANPDLVKQQLADAGLVVEEWGGDIVCVSTSAKENLGITELLENLLVVAEMEDLKANPSQPAVGVVIEAKMDKNKGPLATVLVHDGTLKLNDIIVVGSTSGRIKAMFGDTGNRMKKAEPSAPVAILGLNDVPQVGDVLNVVNNEKRAQVLLKKNREEVKLASSSIHLSSVFDQITAGTIKELNVILKVDVQGSIDPIKTSLEQLNIKLNKVRVIHGASGNITENDVWLAVASKGLIIGFNVGIETGARRLADIENVDIRSYKVIYHLIDDVNKALKGMLEPEYFEDVVGHAEVRAVFSAGKGRKVAGVYVIDGKVIRDIAVRVYRKEQVVAESTVESLRRFKDATKEVNIGQECGVGINGFSEFEEGDVLEFFQKERKGK